MTCTLCDEPTGTCADAGTTTIGGCVGMAVGAAEGDSEGLGVGEGGGVCARGPATHAKAIAAAVIAASEARFTTFRLGDFGFLAAHR